MGGRFLAWVAGWSAALWALLAAATIQLDPAGMRATGWSRTCAPMQAWKMAAFERSGARTVLVGSSRVGLGIEATPAGPLGAQAFNLALPASTMPEVARLAASLMARGSIDSIALGIDYGMFVEKAVERGQGEAPTTPGSWPSRAEMRRALDIACTGYEFDAATGTVKGYLSPREVAQGMPLELAGYARCNAGACEVDYRAGLESLRATLRGAARSRVRLAVFTNPLPALHLEGLRLAGSESRFERWKRDVARVVREEGGEPVRDFAVYSPETAGTGFIDASHYAPGLGRIVLQHLVASPGDTLFGAPLEPSTIEAHLQRDRAARTQWVARHPAEMADLRQRVARLRAAR